MSSFYKKKSRAYTPARVRTVKQHVLPWSTWLDRLPSLAGLNRKDVRNIAAQHPGKFILSEQHTSYVPAIELFRMRRELRAQAALKRSLLQLRRELISKTYGWLLNDDGTVRCRNEPSISIQYEIDRIRQTLSVCDAKRIDIEVAIAKFQNRL